MQLLVPSETASSMQTHQCVPKNSNEVDQLEVESSAGPCQQDIRGKQLLCTAMGATHGLDRSANRQHIIIL